MKGYTVSQAGSAADWQGFCKHVQKPSKAEVSPSSYKINASVSHNHLTLYLIVEVGVLGVMQDCRTGCCGEDWTTRLAVDALENQQRGKKGAK